VTVGWGRSQRAISATFDARTGQTTIRHGTDDWDHHVRDRKQILSGLVLIRLTSDGGRLVPRAPVLPGATGIR
jgi:hypothetical protein